MTAELVKQEPSGYVRVLTMHRPDKKNAFNNAMYRAMADAIAAAQADPTVRVLLITGVGDAFCGIGLGLTMLLHTDINYIAAGARLRLPFVTLGVVPEAASSYLLPIVVGLQRAAEILFTARWIDAEESVALGLTFAVVPRERLFDTALEKATQIAANPPSAVRHTKRLLRVWRREGIAAARQREDQAFQERLGTPENMEAIQAFFERRPANFDKIPPQ